MTRATESILWDQLRMDLPLVTETNPHLWDPLMDSHPMSVGSGSSGHCIHINRLYWSPADLTRGCM